MQAPLQPPIEEKNKKIWFSLLKFKIAIIYTNYQESFNIATKKVLESQLFISKLIQELRKSQNNSFLIYNVTIFSPTKVPMMIYALGWTPDVK